MRRDSERDQGDHADGRQQGVRVRIYTVWRIPSSSRKEGRAMSSGSGGGGGRHGDEGREERRAGAAGGEGGRERVRWGERARGASTGNSAYATRRACASVSDQSEPPGVSLSDGAPHPRERAGTPVKFNYRIIIPARARAFVYTAHQARARRSHTRPAHTSRTSETPHAAAHRRTRPLTGGHGRAAEQRDTYAYKPPPPVSPSARVWRRRTDQRTPARRRREKKTPANGRRDASTWGRASARAPRDPPAAARVPGPVRAAGQFRRRNPFPNGVRPARKKTHATRPPARRASYAAPSRDGSRRTAVLPAHSPPPQPPLTLSIASARPPAPAPAPWHADRRPPPPPRFPDRRTFLKVVRVCPGTRARESRVDPRTRMVCSSPFSSRFAAVLLVARVPLNPCSASSAGTPWPSGTRRRSERITLPDDTTTGKHAVFTYLHVITYTALARTTTPRCTCVRMVRRRVLEFNHVVCLSPRCRLRGPPVF